MKKNYQLPYIVLMLGVILTLLVATLTPDSSALAVGSSPDGVSAGLPQPIGPNNVITDATPTYRWTQVAGATSYQLQVLNEYNSTVFYSFTVPAQGSCNYNVCSFTTLEKRLGLYGYHWRVKVSTSTTWSPLMTFYVRGKSFEHHFTFHMIYTWKTKSGGTWYTVYSGGVNGQLVSNGLPDKCSAAVQSSSSGYDNFEAETKIMITGTPYNGKYPEAYLALRMKNSVDKASQCWYGGYLFGYSRDGKYSFWKMSENGSWIALIPPTYYSAIKKNDWNYFKVYAKGSKFTLSINNKIIRTVTDSTYPIGYVGFEMRNHGANPTTFFADWITVKMLP